MLDELKRWLRNLQGWVEGATRPQPQLVPVPVPPRRPSER